MVESCIDVESSVRFVTPRDPGFGRKKTPTEAFRRSPRAPFFPQLNPNHGQPGPIKESIEKTAVGYKRNFPGRLFVKPLMQD